MRINHRFKKPQRDLQRTKLSFTQIYDQLSTAYKNGDIQPEIRDGQEIRSAKQIYEGLRKAFEQREGSYLRQDVYRRSKP